jgi:hypothetical protein
MQDLESKLKKLSLRPPSEQLDERVLSLKRARPSRPSRGGVCVPLWTAAAASVLMGILGFSIGLVYRGKPSADLRQERHPVTVELLCDSPSGTNPFDFTTVSDDLLRTDWKVKIVKGEEELT